MSRNTFADFALIVEAQARIARDFKTLNDADPALAKAIAQRLAGIVGVNERPPGARPGRPPRGDGQYQKVAAVFARNGNKPLTKSELAHAAGISEGALHTILYSTADKKFASPPAPKGVRGRMIALTLDALAEAMAKPE